MPTPVKGSVQQRELVPVLCTLIDEARRPQSTAHRDIARSKLRALREDANWNTAFVLHNLGSRRCRYLASLGWPVPSRYLMRPWGGNP